MADDVINIKVISSLKRLSGLTGNYYATYTNVSHNSLTINLLVKEINKQIQTLTNYSSVKMLYQ